MEQNNLSFIPKTAYSSTQKVALRKVGMGLVLKISIILLVLSVLLFGGAFVYKRVLAKQIDDLSISLGRAKTAFDPELITEMDRFGSGVFVVQEILTEHLLPSRILGVIEEFTLSEVSFNSFKYSSVSSESIKSFKTSKNTQDSINASLSGEARDYSTLAEQVEVFKRSDDIKDFAFSSFLLTQAGTVSFDLSIEFFPSIFK
ncbi:hypothetical protein ACFLZC_02130 [Patescibacteria group bacterium]